MTTSPRARLAFFKLNTADLEAALHFWSTAFGFAVTTTFEEADFTEHMLALPGQEDGPNLILLQQKGPEVVQQGSAHGPVGLVCNDITASYAHAIECGAGVLLPPFEAGGAKVAMLKTPEGHEIELVQLPTA